MHTKNTYGSAACLICGEKFTMMTRTQKYCGYSHRRVGERLRAKAKDPRRGRIEEAKGVDYDSAFIVITHNPTAERLTQLATATRSLQELEPDMPKVVKITGEMPEWTPPEGITVQRSVVGDWLEMSYFKDAELGQMVLPATQTRQEREDSLLKRTGLL